MTLKVFTAEIMAELLEKAALNKRSRQHVNAHFSHTDPIQKIFNAIMPHSYVRPHKHVGANSAETLIAVHGILVLFEFSDAGKVSRQVLFGADALDRDVAVGAEVPPETWHTVVALERSILLEIKEGPFNPEGAKEFASWSPVEQSIESVQFIDYLKSQIEFG